LAGNADNVSFLNSVLESVDAPDVIVFGFQELIDLESKQLTAKTVLLGNSKRKADGSISEKVSRHYRLWYDKLVLAVRLAMPPDCPYTVVHTENLVGLFSCIFVRNSERISLRDTAITTVKRGMGGRYGNKGAIVTRFVVDDTSICFINCHLAAGQSQKLARNQDVAAILEEKSVFTGALTDQDASIAYVGGGDGSMILDHEICFLSGDLNYRIDLRRDAIISSVESGDLDHLLQHDQLLKEVKQNPYFRLRNFKEQHITFAPTYKYDRNTSTYDTSSKRRAPAWCDRILYRSRAGSAGRVEELGYRRYEVNVSDHRPVSAGFKVRVKSVRMDERKSAREAVEWEWKAKEGALLESAKRFYVSQLVL
jgi:endonuclease/exonuclease/phosphatase family metal-dependent hydrolase